MRRPCGHDPTLVVLNLRLVCLFVIKRIYPFCYLEFTQHTQPIYLQFIGNQLCFNLLGLFHNRESLFFFGQKASCCNNSLACPEGLVSTWVLATINRLRYTHEFELHLAYLSKKPLRIYITDIEDRKVMDTVIFKIHVHHTTLSTTLCIPTELK